MKKHILIALLAMFYTIAGNAQQVKGTVTDKETQKAIPFASIYLPQLEKGTETDDNGNFIIDNLPSGSYKVVVSSIGYATYTTTVNTLNNSDINIVLAPSAIEIEEVIISTPFHKLQSENVMKVERADIEDLKNKGALTLADGITNIAGVESISTGIGIGKPVIRGLSSNRVLVYTQGVRLENQQFGDEHGLGINDAGVESVEVIKGPASLLYGSDALGGVLYLNPEKFAMQNNSEGDIVANYFTNTQGYNTNAGYKISGGKLKFLVRGAYASHTDYETGNKLNVTNSRFKEYDLKTGLGYQVNNFKTELRYNLNRSDLGIPEEIGLQNSGRTPLEPYQKLTNHVISSKTNLFFDKSSLDLTLGYTANTRKEFEEHEHHAEEGEDEHEEHEEHGEEAALHMQLNTLSYNVLYHLPQMGKLETIVGAQGLYQTNKNHGEELLIPDASTNDFGVLATSHYHLKNMDIQLGLRYDNRSISTEEHGIPGDEHYIEALDRNFNSFNAALGFKLNLFENVSTRINFASGFRAPNLAELTSNGIHHGANRFERGNTDLNNERNFQGDLALEYKNEHVEVFINGFYNKVNDYIYLQPDGTFEDETPVYNYMQDNAKLYGGEIGFHLHPHPLDWLHIESSFETVTGKQDNGDYLPLIPANTLLNTLRVEFNDNEKTLKNSYAFISLKNVFDQNNVGLFETRTGGYSLLNAGLGGKLVIANQEVMLKISGNNLLNKQYISHLSRLKVDNIQNIGRNINLGIQVPF